MSGKPLRIIFFGPAGCGKGTQSEKLVQEFGLAHLSTGDALRAEVAAQSELGKRVKAIMEAGQLVDDATIMAIVESAISRTDPTKGFILDGIPRTIGQTKMLDEMLAKIGQPITHVLYLKVSTDILKERICGRLFHPGSGRTYHKKFHPPKKEMTDDITGEPLIIRKDDTEEAFLERMRQYEATSGVCIEYFKKAGTLNEISGDGKSIDEIYGEIKAILTK